MARRGKLKNKSFTANSAAESGFSTEISFFEGVVEWFWDILESDLCWQSPSKGVEAISKKLAD